jgi:hypothetical protein
MIRRCTDADVPAIHAIINDAAEAYRGVIPADCWHEPYMTHDHLRDELAARHRWRPLLVENNPSKSSAWFTVRLCACFLSVGPCEASRPSSSPSSWDVVRKRLRAI